MRRGEGDRIVDLPPWRTPRGGGYQPSAPPGFVKPPPPRPVTVINA